MARKSKVCLQYCMKDYAAATRESCTFTLYQNKGHTVLELLIHCVLKHSMEVCRRWTLGAMECFELLTYKEIVLCWIPSHIGIQGNEMVDKQAKTSLSLEPTSFKIPFSNFKPSINKYILEEWQTTWNNSIGNKLLDIKPTIGEYQSVVRNIRREEVVLARLRLGHTRVTHSYLLQGEQLPQCVGCDAPFTVRHFLLECGDFAQVRNNCFHVNNMKELFQDIHIDSIMTFLRQINLFNKI